MAAALHGGERVELRKSPQRMGVHIDFEVWDGPGFAAALNTMITEPGERAVDILECSPNLTRMYTTIFRDSSSEFSFDKWIRRPRGIGGGGGRCFLSRDAPLGALGGLMLVGLFGLRRRRKEWASSRACAPRPLRRRVL